jgi:hypothetical protein
MAVVELDWLSLGGGRYFRQQLTPLTRTLHHHPQHLHAAQALDTMAAVEPDWVSLGADDAYELYAEAEALGASHIVLKTRKGTQKYIDTKRGQSGKHSLPLVLSLLHSCSLFLFPFSSCSRRHHTHSDNTEPATRSPTSSMREAQQHRDRNQSWEKICRLQLGKALRNARDERYLGYDYYREKDNPDPAALEDAAVVTAVHEFAVNAGIQLTKNRNGLPFTKITPDFFAMVPFKHKDVIQFPKALFPTSTGERKLPKVEQIKRDMTDVSTPPDSPPPSTTTSPSKITNSPSMTTMVFEITTVETPELLEGKLDQIERVLHYLVHQQQRLATSSAATKVALLEALKSLPIVAGFGFPYLKQCKAMKQLLNDETVMKTRPCVQSLHTSGDLFFFVCVKTTGSELASNSSDISSMKRQLEKMEAKVEAGQQQLEAIRKLLETKLSH